MSETLHTALAQETESTASFSLDELRELGFDINLISQDRVGSEFEGIIEQIDENEVEAIDPNVIAEEGSTAWVESDEAEHISEQGYSQRLSWRAGNVGHALDVIRDSIENESDAVEWLELKHVVAAVKAMSNPYEKVDAVIELEAAGYDFARRMNIDVAAFDAVRNK